MINDELVWRNRLGPIIGQLHTGFASAHGIIQKNPYEGLDDQTWLRTAFLKSALSRSLPGKFNGFELDLETINKYPRLHLIDSMSGRLIPFRRAPGLHRSAEHARKEREKLERMQQNAARERYLNPEFDLGLPPSVPKEKDLLDFPIGAIVWNYPQMDESGEPIESWPIEFYRAKDGHRLDEGLWDYAFALRQGSDIPENIPGFEPSNEPFRLLGREDEDDRAESE